MRDGMCGRHNACACTPIPIVNSPAAPQTLTIDVVSDVVCPWCYIGTAAAGRGARATRRARARDPAERELAPVPAQPGPAARRHRSARLPRCEVRRSAACGRDLRARTRRGENRRHRIRVRPHRAPAEHARRASADRRGRSRAAVPRTSSNGCSARTFSRDAASASADVLAAVAARGGARRSGGGRDARLGGGHGAKSRPWIGAFASWA